jgi:hypothetical protein
MLDTDKSLILMQMKCSLRKKQEQYDTILNAEFKYWGMK